jgi:hypothetical protein
MPSFVREERVVTLPYRVKVTNTHIEHAASNDGCRNPMSCMETVGGKESLEALLGESVQHYRVDTGSIKFNWDNYRWFAPTPKKPKVCLVDFDRILYGKRVNPELIQKLKDEIGPHSYMVVAQRGSRIRPNTPARQEQVNAARNRRHASGLAGPNRQSLRRRVIGSGSV